MKIENAIIITGCAPETLGEGVAKAYKKVDNHGPIIAQHRSRSSEIGNIFSMRANFMTLDDITGFALRVRERVLSISALALFHGGYDQSEDQNMMFTDYESRLFLARFFSELMNEEAPIIIPGSPHGFTDFNNFTGGILTQQKVYATVYRKVHSMVEDESIPHSIRERLIIPVISRVGTPMLSRIAGLMGQPIHQLSQRSSCEVGEKIVQKIQQGERGVLTDI